MAMGCFVALMALPAGGSFAQTRVRPGFNLFSVAQDQEIGRQSADEVERQLPILRDRSTEDYINAIGKRLKAVAPGADYAYQFRVVNASDINAFALPGGYMYVNRGLIEAVGAEGQLAGVMAHEMAHVALRHGTNQASKAYLGQAGLGILGGLVDKKSNTTGKVIGAVGGFGLNTLFLKFSRTDEEQADVVGAQMLAQAGYDPMDMADFFEMLRDKMDHDPGKVEQFFSDHPALQDRTARIREEAEMLSIRPTQPVGGFQQVKSELRNMSPAQTMQQIAEGQGQSGASQTQEPGVDDRDVAEAKIKPPSTKFRTFQQRGRFFTVDYPKNWRIYEPAQGDGVTIAPKGGFVDTGGKEKDLIYGVIVNHYDPFDGDESDWFLGRRGGSSGFLGGNTANEGPDNLARATNDLVGTLLKANPNLRIEQNSRGIESVNGTTALSVVLSGLSPATRAQERVTVFTQELPDGHVIYALFIAPQRDYDGLTKTFNRMITSLRVTDGAAHR